MYGCESWTVKKAEHRRTDAFELWCWRRLLRVPWAARRSNQSILKEISPECSLEELMLKLKLQSFGHLMQRADSLEKTLMLGKIEGRERRDDRGWDVWMASPTRWMSILGNVACQSPLSMGFSRQEHWSGLPFPPPGDLPYPGMEPVSPTLQADSLPQSYQGSLTGELARNKFKRDLISPPWHLVQ